MSEIETTQKFEGKLSHSRSEPNVRNLKARMFESTNLGYLAILGSYFLYKQTGLAKNSQIIIGFGFWTFGKEKLTKICFGPVSKIN